MIYNRHITGALFIINLVLILGFLALFPLDTYAEHSSDTDSPGWTVYFRPGVRFGTDDRTLYIMDFLVPLYRDDKNILFANPRFTPNDHDGWEVNLGLGYRRIMLGDRLILGVSGFYDQRKTPWGSLNEQWGIGAEVMADVPIRKTNIGLTGRFNYYHPITPADVYIGPNGGYVYQGNGIYIFDDAFIEEALGGVDGELGVRVPYVSDYVETWVYGGGYHFEGKYVRDIDGFSARIEVIPTDFLKLNYEYRSDRLNNDQHYGEVMVEVPFSIDNLIAGKNPFEGIGKRLHGSRELNERLTESVRRDVDVRVEGIYGKEAAEGLGKLYIIYSNANDYINNIDNIFGEIVYVSETALSETGDGTREKPYASIDEAVDDTRIKAGQSNTICVLNDNPVEPDENMEEDTWAGGGVLSYNNITDYVSLLILGSGVMNLNTPGIPFLNLPDDLPTGYPTIGSGIAVKAPNVTIMGLQFKINGEEFYDLLNNAPITLASNAGGLHGITIRDNFIYFANYSPLAWNHIACGIGVNNYVDEVGSLERPLVIYHNTINVTSPLSTDSTSGIYLNTSSDAMYVAIIDNTITVESNSEASGIFLRGNNILQIPMTDIYAVISDNTISVKGNLSSAYGIKGYSEGLLNAFIVNNDIDVETSSDLFETKAYGVSLENKIPEFDNPPSMPLTVDPKKFLKAFIVEKAILFLADKTIELLLKSLGYSFPMVTGIFYNNMDVVSLYGNASGILCNAQDSLMAYIAYNEIRCGFEDLYFNYGGTYGVKLESGDGYFMPDFYDDSNIVAIFEGNTINMLKRNYLSYRESQFDLYGIYCVADADINAVIGSDENEEGRNVINLSSYDDAYGIKLDAGNSLFAEIVNTTMENGIYGEDAVYGIYLEGDNVGYKEIEDDSGNISTVISPLSIKNNNAIKVMSFDGEATGIYIKSDNKLFADISDNCDISILGNEDRYGIRLEADITGSPDQPLSISNNTIAVSGGLNSGEAAGIFCETESDIFADISDNLMIKASDGTGGIRGGEDTYGIRLKGNDLNFDLSSNDMTVHSENNSAYGIYLDSKEDIDAGTIKHSEIDVTGQNESHGIHIETDGSIGSEDNPLALTDNTITVKSETGDAVGVLFEAPDGIYAKFDSESGTSRSISVTSGSGDAYGIVLDSDGLSMLSIGSTYIEEGIPPIPVGVDLNVKSDFGAAYGVYAVDDTLDQLNLAMSIINSSITVSGFEESVGLKLIGRRIVPGISSNTFTVTSTNGDAAGVFMLGREVGFIDTDVNVFNEISGGSGISYDVIDAVIAEDLGTLNEQINNGYSGWIYVTADDYHNVSFEPNRDYLTLWGEGYPMFGYGSGSAPVFYDDANHFTPGNFERDFSSDFKSIFGIDFHDPTEYVRVSLQENGSDQYCFGIYSSWAHEPWTALTDDSHSWGYSSHPGYWGFKFKYQQVITRVGIKPGVMPFPEEPGSPKPKPGVRYFQIEGSNVSRTEGYEVIGGTFLHSNNKLMEYFEFPNTTPYYYYRIMVLDSWNWNSKAKKYTGPVCIQYLQMYKSQ